MNKKLSKKNKTQEIQAVAILGHGEIGSAMARICREAGYKVYIRELRYDQLKGKRIDYFHVSIPETSSAKFIKTVVHSVKEVKPKLTIINSSTTPGVTRRIYKQTKLPIIHSMVVGLHPCLYNSIKYYFPKIIGPVDEGSLKLAKKHFNKLGLKFEVYDKPEESEAAKLLSIIYFNWNIIFCKWIDEVCNKNGWNFDNVYTKHNKIYNSGYRKLLPNVVRPVLIPQKGPLGGHCLIPDTELFEKLYSNRITKFILRENKRYFSEVKDVDQARVEYIKIREKLVKQAKKKLKKAK